MRRPEYAGGGAIALLTIVSGVLLGGAILALPGCGYTAGYRLPGGVRTIAVPVFRNETLPLRREIELDITRAVKLELELRSDARVVADPAIADAVLEGIVVEFQQGVLTEGAADVVQESGIIVRTRVRLVRTRDGSILVERTISDSAPFSNLAGETIEVARAEAVREIARRIVVALEPWESDPWEDVPPPTP